MVASSGQAYIENFLGPPYNKFHFQIHHAGRLVFLVVVQPSLKWYKLKLKNNYSLFFLNIIILASFKKLTDLIDSFALLSHFLNV